MRNYTKNDRAGTIIPILATLLILAAGGTAQAELTSDTGEAILGAQTSAGADISEAQFEILALDLSDLDLDGNPTMTSLGILGGIDVSINLAPGRYEIRNIDLLEWYEPEAGRISIVGGVTMVWKPVYAPLIEYPLGQIRDRNAWHGKRLEFYVVDENLLAGQVTVTAPLSMTVSSQIADRYDEGIIVFEQSSGYFSYLPSPEQLRQFDLVFSSAGKTQTVSMVPQPFLRDESTFISDQANRNVPSPALQNLSRIHDTKLETGSTLLNNIDHDFLRRVEVSGREIVLNRASPAYRKLSAVADPMP